MTLKEFSNSLNNNTLPDKTHPILAALWYDAKNEWEKAHDIVQQYEGNLIYDRIHAYLHRKEGDIFNAKYWYRRINLPFPEVSLKQEWENLVIEYLENYQLKQT